MFNNRNANPIFINYINKINAALNQTVSEVNSVGTTHSIAHDFTNQMLPYMSFAVKTAKYTLHYTNHPEIKSIAQNICKIYPEITSDMQKIKSISLKFKSCSECVLKYHKDFNQIFQCTFSEIQKISCKQNINSYFLKLIEIYFKGEAKMLKNLLKYRTFPQLRLIAEYMLCLNNQKLKEKRYPSPDTLNKNAI